MKKLQILLFFASLFLITSCTQYECTTTIEVTYAGGVQKDTIEHVTISMFTPDYILDDGCLEEGYEDDAESIVCDLRSFKILDQIREEIK